MKEDRRKLIEKVLKKFDFVNWDRYFGDDFLTFFGWIDREKDKYKDFLLLTFDINGLAITYATSSSKYTQKIADILNFYHVPCRRVEHFADLKNVIKEKQGE